MKKVLYGKSGSGKSREIVKYINSHDNLLIASPLTPWEQMKVLQYETPIQTADANAAILDGFPNDDLFKRVRGKMILPSFGKEFFSSTVSRFFSSR